MEYPLNQSSWRRGWNDTKTIWKSWYFCLFDLLLGGVIWQVFHWYFGLIAVLSVIFCVWVYALALAPIRQRNEARSEFQELQNERIPRISVRPAEGKRESNYERTEHIMWAELQVTNISKQPLEDVVVNIKACLALQEKQNSTSGDDYLIWDFFHWHQTYVYWSERNANHQQFALTMPANTTRVSLVAFQDNSNGSNFNFNSPNHEWVAGGVKIAM
ncbi:MAG: hypothetical protein SU899_00435 [Chloroflexota bacterium]|nr:hypothetical protein [Chloroflexota bacterium]